MSKKHIPELTIGPVTKHADGASTVHVDIKDEDVNALYTNIKKNFKLTIEELEFQVRTTEEQILLSSLVIRAGVLASLTEYLGTNEAIKNDQPKDSNTKRKAKKSKAS